jgi:hypothetical protein
MQTVHVDQLTAASTVLFTFILDRGITWEVLVFCFDPVHYSNKCKILTFLLFISQSASSMLNEKQKDGLGSANDGFYESKREWLGKRHFILAFERYYSWFSLCVPVSLVQF